MENPKFEVADHVIISKHKNNFPKRFMTEKVKNTIPETYIINDLNGKEIVGKFYEK